MAARSPEKTAMESPQRLRVKNPAGEEPSAGWVKSPKRRSIQGWRITTTQSSDVGEHRIVLIESHAAYSAPAGGESRGPRASKSWGRADEKKPEKTAQTMS